MALLLILLLGTSCALQKSNMAGRINGTDIPYTDFVNSHRGHFNNFMAEKGRVPDTEEKKEILRQTWRNITIHTILKAQFKKYSIRVTEREVLDTLISNVPSYLLSSPQLQINGRFDRSLYLQSLEYDTPVNLIPVKRHYYEYLIPIQKLKDKLIDSTMLSKKEVALIQRICASTANIDWIVFDPKDSKVSVSDNEIQAYYLSNLDKYAMDQFYKLDYCLIPVNLTPEDTQQASYLADSLYISLGKGSDFGTLAEKYSAADSSIRGGSLGFVRIADLSSQILKHIENLKTNEISIPLFQDDSWTIYQVVERTKNMIKLNEIVIKPSPAPETVEAFYPRVQSLLELSNSFGLQEAAQEMSYPFFSTPVMQKDSLWVNDMEVVSTIKLNLKGSKKGSILNPLYSKRLSAWVVVQVARNQTRNHKSLSEVKQSISEIIEANNRMQITKQIAEQWRSRNPKFDLSTAINQQMKVISTPAITVNDQLLGKAVESLLYISIKDHLEKTSSVYEFADMILIPIFNNIGVNKNTTVNYERVRKLYLQTVPSDWFDIWLEQQIKSASVRMWQ